jgi:hypothetical protein
MNPLFEEKSIRDGKDWVKDKDRTNFEKARVVFGKKDVEGSNVTNK